jgi:hypothetical protein
VGIELGDGDRHMVNRRRWHLLELCPELERSTGRGAFNRARVLDRVDRRRLVEPRTKRITGGQPSRKAKPRFYQVTPAVLGRRRATRAVPVDHGRRGRLAPGRRQPGEPTEGMVHIIVIGADTHKRSHTLAAVDEGTGRARGGRRSRPTMGGHLAAGPLARRLDDERTGQTTPPRRPITLPLTGVSWVREPVSRRAACVERSSLSRRRADRRLGRRTAAQPRRAAPGRTRERLRRRSRARGQFRLVLCEREPWSAAALAHRANRDCSLAGRAGRTDRGRPRLGLPENRSEVLLRVDPESPHHAFAMAGA